MHMYDGLCLKKCVFKQLLNGPLVRILLWKGQVVTQYRPQYAKTFSSHAGGPLTTSARASSTSHEHSPLARFFDPLQCVLRIMLLLLAFFSKRLFQAVLKKS